VTKRAQSKACAITQSKACAITQSKSRNQKRAQSRNQNHAIKSVRDQKRAATTFSRARASALIKLIKKAAAAK
jgi:hypothetical protein